MGFSNGKPQTLNRQRHSSDKSDMHNQNESKRWGKNSGNGSENEDESESESCDESHGKSQAAFHGATPRHAGPYVRNNLHGRGPGRGGLTGGRHVCGHKGHSCQNQQGAWDVPGVQGVINSKLVRESKKFIQGTFFTKIIPAKSICLVKEQSNYKFNNT
jgi:hypothetical protein